MRFIEGASRTITALSLWASTSACHPEPRYEQPTLDQLITACTEPDNNDLYRQTRLRQHYGDYQLTLSIKQPITQGHFFIRIYPAELPSEADGTDGLIGTGHNTKFSFDIQRRKDEIVLNGKLSTIESETLIDSFPTTFQLNPHAETQQALFCWQNGKIVGGLLADGINPIQKMSEELPK